MVYRINVFVKLEKYRYNTFEILIENSGKTLVAGKTYIFFYLIKDKIFSLLTFVQLQKLLKDKKIKTILNTIYLSQYCKCTYT